MPDVIRVPISPQIPAAALELLVQCAGRLAETARAQALLRMSVDFRDGRWWIAASSTGRNGENEDPFVVLRDICAETSKDWESADALEGEQAALGAIRLLCSSGGGHNTLPPDAQRVMLVSLSADERGTARLVEALNVLAAGGGAEVGALTIPGDGRKLTAFLIRATHDKARHHGLRELIGSGEFADWTLLQRYSDDAGAGFAGAGDDTGVYLPEEVQISAVGLARFLQWVRACPSLYQLSTARGRDLLAVGLRDTGGQSLLALPLANARFGEFLRRKGPYEARFALSGFTSTPERVRRLQDEISKLESPPGYRLRLCWNRFKKRSASERERLSQQIRRLEQELAYQIYVDADDAPPTLLRFTQAQLPAMVEWLRAFEPSLLRDGKSISYLFAAQRPLSPPNRTGALGRIFGGSGAKTRGDGAAESLEGSHFLLAAPHVVAPGANPLPSWETEDQPVIRFAPDPFWSRHYAPSNGHLVFVPEGTHLSPLFHSGEIEEMGQYLRDAIVQWFGEEAREVGRYRSPLYLFDGRPESRAPIGVTVLDRDQFMPITPLQIGWLNDNLMLMQAVDVRDMLTEMANDVGRARLATSLAGQAKSAANALEKAGREVEQQVESQLDALCNALTRQVQGLVESAQESLDQIRTLEAEVKRFDAIRHTMQGTLADANAAVQHYAASLTGLDKRVAEANSEINEALANAEMNRAHLERRVHIKVEELRRQFDSFRRAFDDL